MTTKLIAVDLDGVLANWHRGFLKHYNLVHFEKRFQPQCMDESLEPSSWHYVKELPEDKFKQAVSTFYERPNFWQDLPSYPRNCDAMAEFLASRPDVNVVYLTARPSPTSGASALVQTNRWLRAQNLLGDNATVIIVPTHLQKGGICMELDIDAIIDDHAETVTNLRRFEFNAKLLNRPWNQGVDLPRVSSLKEWLDNLK